MTSPSEQIYLTDRTTIETDQECPRKRWWYKEYNGTGIVPAVEQDYFGYGRQIHQAFADIMGGENWEKVCNELLETIPSVENENQLIMEPMTWLAGMVAAFGLYMWPLWDKEYELVHIESELVLDRDPLWIANTPDVVLRHRKNGYLKVKDFKSVSILGKGWMDYWAYAQQMQINLKAVEEELKEKVHSASIVGCHKGSLRDGKWRHPYVWAYQSPTGDKVQAEYVYGWDLIPVWTLPGGIAGWVESLGAGVAYQQFPTSAPIMSNDRLLRSLIISRTFREKQVVALRDQCKTDEVLLDQVFPCHFSKCRPQMGSACAYLAACHNAHVNSDPIGSGQYVIRVPHHDLEIVMGAEENE